MYMNIHTPMTFAYPSYIHVYAYFEDLFIKLITLQSLPHITCSSNASLYNVQEWQVRMYGGAGPEGGSPDTVETDVSGNEGFQRRGSSGFPTGAINPLMVVQGQGKLFKMFVF